MQFRKIGPVTLPDCSAEELECLRSAVGRERSKVKYMMISTYGASSSDRECGDSHSSDSAGMTVCLCAQSPEKLSAGEWMQQLGMMTTTHSDKARQAVIKERLTPSDNMDRAIPVCRAYASAFGGEEEFGAMPRGLAGVSSRGTQGERKRRCGGDGVGGGDGGSCANACTQTGEDVEPVTVQSVHREPKRRATAESHHLRYMASVLKRLEAKPAARQFPDYVHPKEVCRAVLSAKLGPMDTLAPPPDVVFLCVMDE